MNTLQERQDEMDVLARTLYGEARGEGLTGIEAVANVIMNRVQIAREKGGYWWGNSVKDVCLKPFQFSCWNPDDINFDVIQSITPCDPIFYVCQHVAMRAVRGTLKDSTGGATHYHALSVNPAWARHLIPCAQIGNHLFYREVI